MWALISEVFTYINIIVVVLSKLRETARHVQRQISKVGILYTAYCSKRKTIQDRKDLKRKGMCVKKKNDCWTENNTISKKNNLESMLERVKAFLN
jgi:hypothetical protein